MVKTKFYYDSEDLTSKLSDSARIAFRIRKAGRSAFRVRRKQPNPNGGGASASPPERKDLPSAAFGSSLPLVEGSREAPNMPNSLPLGNLLSTVGITVGATLAAHAAPNDTEQGRAPSKDAQAANTRRDGEPSEGSLLWTPLTTGHPEVPTPFAMGVAVASGSAFQHKVPPKNSLPPSRISEPFSAVVGHGKYLEALGAVAEGLAARKAPPFAKESDPSKKTDPTSRSTTSTHTPPNPGLRAHPSKGPGPTAPTGGDPQGPSPIDYSMKLEAKLPQDMVTEMRSNAAKKARKMVIGRTLGGRATFKALHECLKLHLPTSYVSTTLLTRGYFLILFENEEGTVATRKLTTVDWSGLCLSFSKFSPDFDASVQGAEVLLTHTIKVQFPDLHEQF
ncbi:unnamed protein product [Sphagnum troendelagicum]